MARSDRFLIDWVCLCLHSSGLDPLLQLDPWYSNSPINKNRTSTDEAHHVLFRCMQKGLTLFSSAKGLHQSIGLTGTENGMLVKPEVAKL